MTPDETKALRKEKMEGMERLLEAYETAIQAVNANKYATRDEVNRAMLRAYAANVPGVKAPLEGDGHAREREERGRAQVAAEQAAARGAVINVETIYPAANAEVVRDTVAAVIEQQVKGVEDVRYMRSRCNSAGNYALRVVFAPGVDPAKAEALVRNRVQPAMAMLPEAVVRRGVTVRRRLPLAAMIVCQSPEGRYDAMQLGDIARTGLAEVLARVPGVGELDCVGDRDGCIHLSLSVESMAAYGVTPAEVVEAVQREAARAANAPPQPPEKPKTADASKDGGGPDGRMRPDAPDVAQLADLPVKTETAGRVVRLKDVARIDLGTRTPGSLAFWNGKPAVVLAIHPVEVEKLSEVCAAVRRELPKLKARLPAGLAVEVVAEASPGGGAAARPGAGLLLIEPVLPDGVSLERTLDVLDRCKEHLGTLAQVQDLLILAPNPADDLCQSPCMVARLAPAERGPVDREETAKELRRRLARVQEGVFPSCDASQPGHLLARSYPIDLAVYGPELGQVRKLAERLAQRLEESKKATDLFLRAASDSPADRGISMDIDRAKAAELGVAIGQGSDAVQMCLGSMELSPLPGPGAGWPVQAGLNRPAASWGGPRGLDRVPEEDMKKVLVRGGLVPLTALVSTRDVLRPQACDRLDLLPMIEITANPAAEASPDAVRTLCETLLEEARKELGLPAAYRLRWLD